MIPKVIKSKEDHKQTLHRIGQLMEAKAGSKEADELELLGTLVQVYEQARFPVGLPSPVEAIKFRMEQMGMKHQDLVPYIGSRSKVSEVLSGKRPLSLSMIRALHDKLGIPADVLLAQPNAELPQTLPDLEIRRFPIAEMISRGWVTFSGATHEALDCAEEIVRSFVDPVRPELGSALFRRNLRSGSKMDEYALLAWRVQVLRTAVQEKLPRYQAGCINDAWLRQLVSLSYLDQGPRLAQEYLGKSGIHLVVLQHLPHTHLDGAAMLRKNGAPVVALTLRHDRIDNFWFTLLHEIAHIAIHLKERHEDWFVDDLDVEGDKKETEADDYAMRHLIPPSAWKQVTARQSCEASDVKSLAKNLRIHPAIIAGRIRREAKNYRLLHQMVGQGTVRKQFREVRIEA